MRFAYSVGLLKKEPRDRLRVLLLISETRDHGSHTKLEDAVAAIGQAIPSCMRWRSHPALSNILDTAAATTRTRCMKASISST